MTSLSTVAKETYRDHARKIFQTVITIVTSTYVIILCDHASVLKGTLVTKRTTTKKIIHI